MIQENVGTFSIFQSKFASNKRISNILSKQNSRSQSMNAPLWRRMHTVTRSDMERVLDSLRKVIREMEDFYAFEKRDWANKMFTANAFTRSLRRQMQQFNRITANDQFWKELIDKMKDTLDEMDNMHECGEYQQQQWDDLIESAIDAIDDLEIYVVTTGDLNAIRRR